MSVKRYEFELYHCNGGEMLVSETGGYVSHDDYAALEQQLAESHRALRAETTAHENTQMQLEKMAAELSAIDSIHDDAAFITDEHYEQCPPEVQKIIRSLAVLQVPAYQYFLAEVRAQESKRVYESILDNPAVTDMESLVDWLEQYANDSVAFAAQLRKGVQS